MNYTYALRVQNQWHVYDDVVLFYRLLEAYGSLVQQVITPKLEEPTAAVWFD